MLTCGITATFCNFHSLLNQICPSGIATRLILSTLLATAPVAKLVRLLLSLLLGFAKFGEYALFFGIVLSEIFDHLLYFISCLASCLIS